IKPLSLPAPREDVADREAAERRIPALDADRRDRFRDFGLQARFDRERRVARRRLLREILPVLPPRGLDGLEVVRVDREPVRILERHRGDRSTDGGGEEREVEEHRCARVDPRFRIAVEHQHDVVLRRLGIEPEAVAPQGPEGLDRRGLLVLRHDADAEKNYRSQRVNHATASERTWGGKSWSPGYQTYLTRSAAPSAPYTSPTAAQFSSSIGRRS